MKELSMENLNAIEYFNTRLLVVSYALNLFMKCEAKTETEIMAKNELLFICSDELNTIRNDFNTFFICVCNGHDFNC